MFEDAVLPLSRSVTVRRGLRAPGRHLFDVTAAIRGTTGFAAPARVVAV